MSDIIYTPPASSGGGTTINSTDGAVPVRLNSTTFIDSGYYVDFGNSNLYFNQFLSDNNNNQVLIGDTTYNYSNTIFLVDRAVKQIYTYDTGNYRGIHLDFGNELYRLGDYNNDVNGGTLVVDVNTPSIYTNFFSNTPQGLYVDPSNTKLGDLSGALNLTQFLVDYSNDAIFTNFSNNGYGLLLDFQNRYFSLGDYGQSFNNTFIQIDDNVKNIRINANQTEILLNDSSNKISFYTSILDFVGAALQSNTAGGSSGRHLVITLNNIQYKIALLNP